MEEEPTPDNNEFKAAEDALRKLGSNLWFGGLPEQWKDFLISNTVDFFDSYEVSMEQAARELIRVYRELIAANPDILQEDPWASDIDMN